MLAWRGKTRDKLLATLREISAGRSGPCQETGAADPPAPPLPESAAEFWSAPLSPARLRTLSAPAGSSTPDLLLRMFPPPPVPVRGQDLAEVLASAYGRLAAEPALPGES